MKRELTKTELKILKLSGYKTKTIADKLCVSISTVKDHFTNIRRKLNAKSKEQSLIIALKHHCLDIKDVDLGFWDSTGTYIEDIQEVDFTKE